MSASAAAQAVKKFRLNEISSLRSHLLRVGPLPAATGVTPLHPELDLPNPFVPIKNEQSGKWVPPKYSLRQQAVLVKKAKESGLLHLLPPSPKNPTSQLKAELKKARVKFVDLDKQTEDSQVAGKAGVARKAKHCWKVPVSWHGKFNERIVPGAELGIRLYAGKKAMFKGHKWERVKESREKRQKILLRDMDKRIERYKTYYKKKRPSPLLPPRSSKNPKLPF